MYFCQRSLLLMHPATENLSITKSTTTKKLDPRNTKKKIGPTKYSREKFWVQKVSARKNFGPTNTHEKIFWTQEIPTRKHFGPTNTHEKSIRPTKYPREKILYSQNTTKEKLGPRNTYECMIAR